MRTLLRDRRLWRQLMCSTLLTGGLCTAEPALAVKLAVTAGYFNLAASTSETEVSLDNLGLYRFSYLLPIARQFEFNAGYSLYILGTSAIDLGFGPDIGISYFFLSGNDATQVNTANVTMSSFEIWRPFIGLQFSQRQYQSVQSTYAGLNLNAGADYALSDRLAIRGVATYQALNGPLSARVTEYSLVGGVVVDL